MACAAAATPAAQAAYPGDNGKIAYVKNVDGTTAWRLHVVNADGTGAVPLTSHTGMDFHPAWSPDGTKLAYQSRRPGDADYELRVIDLVAGTDVALTDDAVSQQHPTWSPDGAWIAYDQGGDIWKIPSDPASAEEPVNLLSGATLDTEPSWSVNDQIAFSRDVDGAGNIRVMPSVGGSSNGITIGLDDETSPNWAPDGVKVAYVREGDIAVRTPFTGDETILSPDESNDLDPAWSPDGQRLVWRSLRVAADIPATRLWTMKHDGTEENPLLLNGLQPDWQPVRNDPEPEPEPEPQPNDPGTGGEPQPQPTPKTDSIPPAAQPSTPAAEPRRTTQASRAARRCVSKRSFEIRLRIPRGERVGSAKVTVNGKPAKVRLDGKRHVATVDLRRLPRGTWTVKVTTKTKSGRTVRETRRYRTCAPKRRA